MSSVPSGRSIGSFVGAVVMLLLLTNGGQLARAQSTHFLNAPLPPEFVCLFNLIT